MNAETREHGGLDMARKARIAQVFSIAAGLCLSGASAQAAFVPSGVQFNVPEATVTGAWGWTEIFRDFYGGTGPAYGYSVSPTPIADVFADAGEWLMLAAKQTSSSHIALLAAVKTDTFLNTITAESGAYDSNGAGWYYNALSLGFVREGDTPDQDSADVDFSTNSAYRLSWHTSLAADCSGSSGGDIGQTPLGLCGGYRAGSAGSLNRSDAWERLVFSLGERSDASEVPLPGALPLMAAALGAFAIVRRRRCLRTPAPLAEPAGRRP